MSSTIRHLHRVVRSHLHIFTTSRTTTTMDPPNHPHRSQRPLSPQHPPWRSNQLQPGPRTPSWSTRPTASSSQTQSTSLPNDNGLYQFRAPVEEDRPLYHPARSLPPTSQGQRTERVVGREYANTTVSQSRWMYHSGMAVSKKSVLVTGGNGFIASHIIAQLLAVCFS